MAVSQMRPNNSAPSAAVASTNLLSNHNNSTNNNCVSEPTKETDANPLVDVDVVDIGLQTDLEEDPDVFYFAGGRIVASQTDESEDYGPLNPSLFSKSKNSVILVRSTSRDSDGWETVKTRSGRSSNKWSSSNSSLGSTNANNQSRNSLDKGTPKKLSTTENSDNQKKGSAVGDDVVIIPPSRATPTPTDDGTLLLDDEEIQKKEADLDDAIREEELIEEELRQVEKDFERIENDSAAEEGTITDSEHAISPDPEVDVVDFEEMDDQFFFVSIDGQDQMSVSVEDMPPREPGRTLTLREKLMSPAKKADGAETLKKVEAKLAKAERNRENLLQSKFNRYVELSDRAAELGAPRVQEENNGTPSSYRVCTLCSVIIHSGIHEMQHIRSRGHLDAVKKADKSSNDSSSNGGNNDGGSSSGGEVNAQQAGFGYKFIADVGADKIEANKIQPDRNRNKGLKKHSKKLMQKLMESGLEFEKSIKEDRVGRGSGGSGDRDSVGGPCDPYLKSKTRKNILELDRLISLFNSGKGSSNIATSMDRIMADIRKTSVQNIYMKDAIIGMNGLEIALKVLQCSAGDLPPKSKIHAIEMIHGFILGSLANGLYILRGTGICTLMNLCAERWSTLIPDDNRWLCRSPSGVNESLPTDYFIQSVVSLLFNVLEYVPNPFSGILKKGSFLTQDEIKSIKNRTFDIIGYLVASGVIDRISVYCSGVRGPVDDHPDVACLLQVFLDFLVVLVYTLQFCWGGNPAGCIMQKKESGDGTQLLAALEASELAGAVSMSYSLLLHQGAPSRPRAVDGKNVEENALLPPPPPPGEKTAEIVKSTLCLINAMARLDLPALQNVLASEAVCFRHIASQLLWQVLPHRSSLLMRRLLSELITSIGNFTVGNRHNQATIQSGQTPTVLQLLCTLPSEYFTDIKFKHNFISTLLAATEGCPENKEILVQNNVDLGMLEDYISSEDGKKNVFVQRMLYVTSQQQLQQSLASNATIDAAESISTKSATTSSELPNNKQLKKGGKVKKPLEESNV